MMESAPETEARVERNTDQEINERIHRELEARVYYYAQRPSEINHERFALKALRGDFAGVYTDGQQTPDERASRAIEAADAYL